MRQSEAAQCADFGHLSVRPQSCMCTDLCEIELDKAEEKLSPFHLPSRSTLPQPPQQLQLHHSRPFEGRARCRRQSGRRRGWRWRGGRRWRRRWRRRGRAGRPGWSSSGRSQGEGRGVRRRRGRGVEMCSLPISKAKTK